MLEIGSVVDNKYKILHQIGKGGMSRVYLALNESANKEWAIKEVQKNVVVNGEEVWQRPLTETAIMKKLKHPNLPQIADVLETDESYMIVMDYIEGKTLKKILQQEGPQKQEDVVNWALQLCDVLKYLHTRTPKIIYRDMKPVNIMLKPDGNVVLIDFGAAREYKDYAEDDTRCLGTKGYAAPEQYGGAGQTDERTDIYNLGATMYHLVTGKDPSRPPYEMKPIRAWNRSLSTGLEKIIRICTRNDPDERYQTADELAYALRHYREMEAGYRRRKKRQWNAFVAVAAASVISLAGAFGTHIYAGSLQSGTYGETIHRAETAVTKEQQVEEYRQAVKTDPYKEEAYEKLLNNVFLVDGVLSQDEADTMTEVLGYRDRDGRKTAEEYFKTNAAGYDRFCYNMGLAFFYYYGDGGSKQLSRPWFEQAKESRYLDEAQRTRAERFYRIADYYTKLGDRNMSGDSVVSYAEYWSDLLELCRGDIIRQDNIRTALVMYREMAYQIGAHADDFRSAGVKEEELTSQLKQIRQIISDNEDSFGEGDEKLAEEIEGNIRAAEKAVGTAFAE